MSLLSVGIGYLSTQSQRFFQILLPSGFHRIRHYGLLANAHRKDNLIKARKLIKQEGADLIERHEGGAVGTGSEELEQQRQPEETATYICRHCGAVMTIVQSFMRGQFPRAPPVIEAIS